MPAFSTRTQVDIDSALRDGITKNHKASEKLVANREEVTMGDITAALNERIKLGLAAERARELSRKATADHLAAVERTKVLVGSVRTQIVARIGADDPGLLDYGIAPRKGRAQLTVEEKAFKVAKAKATRTARGTLGKRELAAVRGEAPAQIILGDAPPPQPIASNASPSVVATNGATNGAKLNGAATNSAAQAPS
jgi:hypothetical protein